jgi:hypothetical protein
MNASICGLIDIAVALIDSEEPLFIPWDVPWVRTEPVVQLGCNIIIPIQGFWLRVLLLVRTSIFSEVLWVRAGGWLFRSSSVIWCICEARVRDNTFWLEISSCECDVSIVASHVAWVTLNHVFWWLYQMKECRICLRESQKHRILSMICIIVGLTLGGCILRSIVCHLTHWELQSFQSLPWSTKRHLIPRWFLLVPRKTFFLCIDCILSYTHKSHEIISV